MAYLGVNWLNTIGKAEVQGSNPCGGTIWALVLFRNSTVSAAWLRRRASLVAALSSPIQKDRSARSVSISGDAFGEAGGKPYSS